MNFYKKLKFAQQYGYRGIDNPQQIKIKGLIPNYKVPKDFDDKNLYLYFANNAEQAKKYGSILIRFPFPKDSQDSPIGNYYVSKIKIPPQVIEINMGFLNGNYTEDWQPLLNFK